MAHYADVNEGALISAINSCKSSLHNNEMANLKSYARSLKWDGTAAKDNLLTGIDNIATKTNSLANALDGLLSAANLIKKYKKIKEKLDNAERDLSKLKSAKAKLQSQYNKDPLAPSAGYIKSEINRKSRSISAKQSEKNELEKDLKATGRTLSGMGYPPV